MNKGRPYAKIEITHDCNMKCSYCSLDFWRDGINKKRDSGVVSPQKVLKQLRNNQYTKEYDRIVISGGEPLLYPEETATLIKFAISAFPVTPIYVFTNGTLLNDELVEFFNDNNICVIVSLHAPQKINPLYVSRLKQKTLMKVVRLSEEFAGEMKQLHKIFNHPITAKLDIGNLHKISDKDIELFKTESLKALDEVMFDSYFFTDKPCSCETEILITPKGITTRAKEYSIPSLDSNGCSYLINKMSKERYLKICNGHWPCNAT